MKRLIISIDPYVKSRRLATLEVDGEILMQGADELYEARDARVMQDMAGILGIPVVYSYPARSFNHSAEVLRAKSYARHSGIEPSYYYPFV